jgi:hypothetical protein
MYDHVHAFMREPGTHTHGSVSGWLRPATFGEIAAAMLTQRVVNYLRTESTPAVSLPFFPWPDGNYVEPEVRAELERQLDRRSPFGKR